MEKEIWKDVVGYEGHYKVSNLGNVKSLKFNKVKTIKQRKNKKGYLIVNLCLNSTMKTKQVHKLVAEAFLNHIPKGMKEIVDHIDNDKSNNKLTNLQLISNRMNSTKDRSGYSSKHVGVSWNKSSKKWCSFIFHNKVNVYLGCFDSEEEASVVYQQKLTEINNQT